MGVLIDRLTGLGLSAKLARAASLAMLGLVLLLVLWGAKCAVDWGQRHTAATKARIEAGRAGATIASGQDAVATVSGAGEREAGSEAMTAANDRDIRAADGAGEAVKPGVRDAGLTALCKRAAYRDAPRCKGAGR